MSVAHHSRNLTGFSIKLRPVEALDAEFILKLRGGDGPRFRYLNPISSDIEAQKAWINQQRSNTGDYYFVIEDRPTGEAVGLVGVYDIADGSAEWGRWILREGSDAAIDSVRTLMNFCFSDLGLNSVYCRTISENDAVVRFHDGYADRIGTKEPELITLRGETLSLVRHELKRESFEAKVKPIWDRTLMKLFSRRIRMMLGHFEFHHVGIATRSIAEAATGFSFLGYAEEAAFSDPAQGVRGLFMAAKGHPRIELLENLEGSATLDSWLKYSVSVYHFAYRVNNLDYAVSTLNHLGVRAITAVKKSVYFGSNIVFMVLPNKFVIELIGP